MNTSEVKAFFEKTDVYLTYNYNLRIRAETVGYFIADMHFEKVLDMPCGTGDISAPFIDKFDRSSLLKKSNASVLIPPTISDMLLLTRSCKKYGLKPMATSRNPPLIRITSGLLIRP